MQGIKLEQTKKNKKGEKFVSKLRAAVSMRLFTAHCCRYQFIAETNGRSHYRYRNTGSRLILVFRSIRRHQTSIDKYSK